LRPGSTLAGAAVAAALLVAGCGSSTPEPELRPGVLRIGVVTPRNHMESEIVNGVRVAVRELDRDGGIDHKVRLHTVFGTSERLAGVGVRVVVLPCGERAQEAAAEVARRRRALMLEPCNTGLWRRFARLWPVSASPAQEADAVAAYADREGHDRVAVLGDSLLRRAFRRRGIRRTTLRHADAVAVGLEAPAADEAVARLRRRGIDVPVIATHRLDDAAAIRRYRRALEGVTFTTFAYPEPGLETDEFYERYRAVTGRRPQSSVAALGYDAIRVLDSAVNEAVSTEPRALNASMPGLDAYGATGKISYPERGGRDPAVSLVLVKVERGSLVLVDRVDV
jgi:ABC-type branched-subunit amino acid transport system substrate-binding protein